MGLNQQPLHRIEVLAAGAHRLSRMDGASWVASMQPGSLQSKARSGLRSMRRWQLPHSAASRSFKNASKRARYCGRHSAQPSELICKAGSVKPSAWKKS